MGFSVSVTGGRVSSLIDAPAGWHFTINNDPSWNSVISGHAIVGAASLTRREFAKLFDVQTPPLAIVRDLHTRLHASESLTLMNSGRLMTKLIPAVKFDPIPAASPRTLHSGNGDH